MRRSALVARRDGVTGCEVLVVHRPVAFTLREAALAMHAIVDPHLTQAGTRRRVGRSRVREVLHRIATDGWPEQVQHDPARLAYWRRWLIEQAVFTDDDPD